MSKPRVVMTRPIPETGIRLLQEQFDLVVHDDTLMSKEELMEFVKGAEAIIPLLTEKIDDDVLEAAGPQLKVVAQYTVGFDNVDLEAASKRGIMVTHTPGTLSGVAVAEYVMGAMLAVARHMVAADAFMREGKYEYWKPDLMVGPQLSGKTVGIVGTGEIGSLFAAMCHNGLRMRVLYTDLASRPELEKSLGATKVDLEHLLAKSDVVSLHVPLLDSTRHLIGAEQLKLMKETAVLINTARGPVVDEKALVQALKEGQILGAALDVFEEEPALAEGLKDLSNVLLTPHIASATETARLGMAECVARNVAAALAGERPPHLVNTVQK